MRSYRIYINQDMMCGQSLVLPEQQSHHLGKVLRMRTGEYIHLFNGVGGYFVAEIKSIDKRAVTVVPAEFVPDDDQASIELILAQGISRGRHMDYTIQKAVETGVAGIIPLITENSNVHLTEKNRDNKFIHWRNIVINACEQSGRNVLPEIYRPVGFNEWIAKENDSTRLLLDPASGCSLSSITTTPEKLTIISGPEGGLSDQEQDLAARHMCIRIRLGPRVLRTETAAIAAISACQVLWGDMK